MKCRNMQHSSGLALVAMINTIFRDYVHNYCNITTCDPLKYRMDNPILIVSKSMGMHRVNPLLHNIAFEILCI